MKAVKTEGTGWRDSELSLRHRTWGYDCPMVDIDFLVVEYDKATPQAIIEYKREKSNVDFSKLSTLRMAPQSYEALNKLANLAKLPFFVVQYKKRGDNWKSSRWNITPRNEIANQWIKQYLKTTKNLTEEEYVAFLYNVRWRELPIEIHNELTPTQEVPPTD